MKNIEELKSYYFEHKQEFESSTIFVEQNNNLEIFRKEYPLERFSDLSLEEYALGTDNKDSLCYQMEFGKYKHTGPGIGGSTAFKYGIYYSKDKNSFVTRAGIVAEPEQTWINIRNDFSKVLYSVANANLVTDIKDDYSSLKGMPMYIIKLAFCYFPEKLICIAGRKQLKGVLDLFEIEYDDNYSSLQLAFLINQTIRNSIPEIASDSSITFGNLIWDFYYINSDNTEREGKKLEKIHGSQDKSEQSLKEYTKFDFLKEVLITEEKYDNIVNTLVRKKNIILQGAPGVGKTFCAKKIMYSLMNYKDESRIKTVQFHQSYSYEDFIQGYRPSDEGNFEIKNGIFYDLVQEARKEYERAIANNEEPKKYCMIIDEINRGNLSKVFGELMMLIESDKRDSKWSIDLTYSDEDFYIPSNLYIIGTMNTADRSLATIDYALRRRFAFINLEPAFENDETCDKLRNYLVNQEKIEVSFVERIITAYRRLNNYIIQVLSKDFTIGHSYFINQFNNDEDNEEVYKSIVDYEILPLLDEYFYDDKDKVEEAKKIIEKI